MDHLSQGCEESDSSIIPRPTGKLPFKKLKRTRMRVDHLTDEEKRWRKRILGRERARRYRERKRASESSPEESSDACLHMEALSPKQRGRGRPKGSRTKKRRLVLLTPLSKNFERGGSEVRKLPTFGFVGRTPPSSKCPKQTVDPHQLDEATCSSSLHDSGTCTSSNSLVVNNPASIGQINVGACTSIKISPMILESLQDNTIMIKEELVENLSNEAEENIFEDPLSHDNPNKHLISWKMEAVVKKLDLQDSDVHIDDSPGTSEDPKNSGLADNSFHASKMYSGDLVNLSKYCEQKVQSEPRLHRRKRRFKQQNVRDFINFFPTDNLGCIDSKSFVTGSCSLQRKVEYVPSGKRLLLPKPSACETSPKLQASIEVVNVGGLGNLSHKDSEVESVKSKGLADACPREKVAEKQTGVSSVEPISTSSAAQATQGSLGSAQSSGSLPVPVVYESLSAQPSALVGVSLPQTLQDVQISGLMQQQLLNASSNVQALNTVNVAGQANIVASQKASESKGAPSLQGVTGLPKLEGLTGIQSVAGIQGMVGTSTIQGIQGVTDPRYLSLAGLQGVSGIQNFSSLQGVVGGLTGLSGLQAVTSQGFGCLPGISGSTSPAALVGIQGIPNLQAVQAFQGMPGFQPMTGLQGLVTLGITGVPGIQGLQGLGIAGLQSAPALQAVTTLQGGTYLQGITGLQGASGLISGFQSPAGMLFGQQELSTAATAAHPEGTANQKEDVGHGVNDQGVNDQGVNDQGVNDQGVNDQGVNDQGVNDQGVNDQGVNDQGEKGITTDLNRGQPCLPGKGNAEDESLGTGASICQEPNDVQTTSQDVAASITEKMQRLQKGRSRRKQASPKCITKQLYPEFTSGYMYDTDEDLDSCTLSAEDTPTDDGSQSKSFSAITSPESKELDLVTASPPQKEGSVTRPQARDKVDESPRPGEKLSKKVEELMSATHPHHTLDVDCLASVPTDDESPSPQTWQRFLEREKQRHNRLKEVEEQLARLQAHADRCQAFSPTSFVSTATQTDPGGSLGNQDGGIDTVLQGSANTRHEVPTADGQAEGSGVTCGQIQQGVVTSSGDSLFGNLSPEANGSEDEVLDIASSVTEDIPVSQNKVPSDIGQDTEAKIKNSPRTIWLHSGKKKRKATRGSIRSLMSPLAEGSSPESKNPSDHEATDACMSLNRSPSPSPPKKMTKFVFQIPLDDLDTSDNYGQVDEANEIPNENRQDNKFEMPISGSVSDSYPSIGLSEQSMADFPFQSHSVLPWEVEGLSKIERNRIRAREGMRKHREKLRQAKLAAKTPLMYRSVLPEKQPCLEASPVIWGSGVLDVPVSMSPKTPDTFNKGSIRAKIEIVEDANCTSILPPQDTTGHPLSGAEVIESTSQVPGSKKPFDILAQVAVKIEPSEINTQETTYLPSTQRTEEPSTKTETIASHVGADVQTTDKPVTESILALKISKSKPANYEAGSPSNVGHIDFTQEPYRSMSLRDRNRIRAREGMRRYRERMRLARLTPLYQPQKVSFGMQRSKGGSLKSGKGKHQGGAKCRESVAASSQLVELAKRHTEESGPAFSYSEILEHGKAELIKRKRAFSLHRHGDLGRPKKKSIGKHLPLSQVTESYRLQDEASSGLGTVTLKSGRIVFPPKEIILDRESDSTIEDPEDEDYNPTFTKPTKCPIHSSEDHLKRPATISSEISDDSEDKSLKSEEMTEELLDLALRKKVIQEKMMCGMDKYAAISSSAAAQRHAQDLAAGASHLGEEQEETEKPEDLAMAF